MGVDFAMGRLPSDIDDARVLHRNGVRPRHGAGRYDSDLGRSGNVLFCGKQLYLTWVTAHGVE